MEKSEQIATSQNQALAAGEEQSRYDGALAQCAIDVPSSREGTKDTPGGTSSGVLGTAHEGAEEQFLICTDELQSYAIPVSVVKEITVARQLQPLPEERADLLGLMSIRGQLVPILDTNKIIQMSLDRVQQRISLGRQCVVICELGGREFGIFVEEARKVVEIDRKLLQEIELLPSNDHSIEKLAKSGDESLLLLNLETLLLDEPC